MREGAEEVEGLLRLGEGEADRAVVVNVDEEVGSEWVELFPGAGFHVHLGGAAQTEQSSWLDGWRVFLRWRNHGIETEWGFLQLVAAAFKELEELKAEFVEREAGEARRVVEVFEIEDFVLEFLELFVAEAEILADKVVELIDFQKVVGLGGFATFWKISSRSWASLASRSGVTFSVLSSRYWSCVLS